MSEVQPGEAPATERQLLLTAWLDGELDPAERARFERMLAEDPELAADAAAQKELIDLTRSPSVLEPTEAEMRRFWASFYNRTEWQVAWILLLLGVAGLLGEGLYLLISSALSWTVKAAVLSTLSGGALLIWNTARLKMRTSRFDRYRGVMR
ncbi:MAG TPA: zf-HC2 domain-containing protein [Planctomycetota bacterium]|nr:zf-HC2 domain-containing protein [Planctomycetota bacterium]